MAHQKGWSSIATILGISGVALVSAPANALDMDLGVGYSALYSDNIGRVATNEQDEWVNILRGLFSLQEISERMDARLFSQLEFRQYTQDTYDNEAMFGLDGAVTWTISPQRFTFTLEDRFTQTPASSTLAVTPGNRQDTNVLSLGPNFIFRPTRVDRAELGGRYSNTYYEVADTDSDRLWGYARWIHQVSPLTQVSVNYEPSYVDYRSDTLNPDYERQDIFLNGRTQRFGTDLSLDVGRILIERDAARDVEGTLLRARLARQMTPRSSFEIIASDDYSDAGRETLLANPLLQIIPSPTEINTTDFVGGGLFAAQQVDAAYVYTRYYGINRVNLYWRELDFESDQLMLDQRIAGVFFDLGYDHSGALSPSIFGNYSEITYHNVPREDKDYGLGARVIYRLHRSFSVGLETLISERDSNLPSFDFREWRTVLTLGYNSNYALTVGNPFLEQTNPLYR